MSNVDVTWLAKECNPKLNANSNNLHWVLHGVSISLCGAVLAVIVQYVDQSNRWFV